MFNRINNVKIKWKKYFNYNLLRIKKYFDDQYKYKILKKLNYTVYSGPFKGMRYINQSNGSELLPKVIGVYEFSIQHIFEHVVNSDYKNVIDIGCAEGYYAVGLAYRFSSINKKCKVFAFDINNEALNNLNQLALINNVSDNVISGTYFDPSMFKNFDHKSFVICDIEGSEIDMLNPQTQEALKYMDILVEVHDGGEKSNKIKSVLYNRFSQTHSIEFFKYVLAPGKLFGNISLKKQARLLDEKRRFGLEWMFMRSNLN
jgi:hypothetical protein